MCGNNNNNNSVKEPQGQSARNRIVGTVAHA